MADKPPNDDHTDQKALTTPDDRTQVQPVGTADCLLTKEEFQRLPAIPPELEWFAKITNANTQTRLQERHPGLLQLRRHPAPGGHMPGHPRPRPRLAPELVTKGLADATIRRKLSEIAALFAYLAENNAIAGNPVHGVKRPRPVSREGASPAQARAVLDAPDADSLKGSSDRAILATPMFHGLRRAELCALTVGNRQQRQGTSFLRMRGKGSKIQYKRAHPEAGRGADLRERCSGR